MTVECSVDVAMATYNHESYIAQAIESVMAQKTDFPVRLIVGDDCSSDRTPELVRDFAARYPGRVIPLLSPVHLGLVHKDRVGLQTLRQCTARYVAILDGDDYWTDGTKLAKQVAFLEAHPDYSICFHNVLVHHENGAHEDYPFYQDESTTRPVDMGYNKADTADLTRVLHGSYIQTPAMVMRNVFGQATPDWLANVLAGDWAISILAARQGRIKYIDEVMAAYRVHGGGAWSSLTVERRMNTLLADSYTIRANVPLDFSERIVLNTCIVVQYGKLVRHLRQQGRRGAAIDCYRRMLTVRGNHNLAFMSALGLTVAKRMLPGTWVRGMFGFWRKIRSPREAHAEERCR